jgi:hypothetical protein
MMEKNMKKAEKALSTKKLRTIPVMCLLISCIFGVVFVTSEQVSATDFPVFDIPKFSYNNLNSFQSNIDLDSYRINYDWESFENNINLDSFKINNDWNSINKNINWNPVKINTNLNSIPINYNLDSFENNIDLDSLKRNMDFNYKIPDIHIPVKEFAVSQIKNILPSLEGVLLGCAVALVFNPILGGIAAGIWTAAQVGLDYFSFTRDTADIINRIPLE